NSITCNGDNNGSLRIQLTNGLAPYAYALDSDNDDYDRTGNITSQNSGNIEYNLGPGTYTATVNDFSGAFYSSESFTLEEPPVLTATIAVLTNPTSPGTNDGSFTASILGGVANYSMLIYIDGFAKI